MPVSMVFPGHVGVTATGGSSRASLQRKSTGVAADTVTYSFTASRSPAPTCTTAAPTGRAPDRDGSGGRRSSCGPPRAVPDQFAYNHADTAFDHEYLFLLSQMDPIIHQLAEQGRFAEIDMAKYYPVYWFVNGRAAPDTLAAAVRGLAASSAVQFIAAHDPQARNC